MKILSVVAGIWKHTGGPAEVIPKLCEALVNKGCFVTLLTVDGPHSDAALASKKAGVDLVSFPVRAFSPIRYTPGISSFLAREGNKYDVIHNNGHWLHPNWMAFFYAKRLKKPLVTTPHGTLVPGMLARSRFKKWLSWNVFDKRLIEYSSIIHALSSVERDEMLRKVGNKNLSKMMVIPNGADIWKLPERQYLQTRFPQLKGKKVALFLSRVHPIKGVFDLLEVWQKQHKNFSDWHLLFVGSIDKEVEKSIKERVKDDSMQKAITFAGPIYGEERLAAFAVADTFILPSYGEGLPTAILEALSSGIPAICTNECNFSEAVAAGAAFSGPAGIKSLTSNLVKMLNLSDRERKTMGQKGQTLIDTGYRWENIAQRWIDIYEKVIFEKIPW